MSKRSNLFLMTDNPLVSIIALNYNQSGFLVESLDAIAGQSYKNFEIIITDDCSKDDSRVKIDTWIAGHPELQITRLYNESNQGLCKTLNKAVNLTKGYYVKPIACDDIMLPDYLENVIMKFNEGIDLVFTDMMLVNENGEIRQTSNYRYNGVNPADYINRYEALLDAQYVAAPTIIYKKDLYEKTGGYNESLAYEDWDFLLKAQKVAKFGFIDQPLVKYRVHEHNMHKSLKNDKSFIDSTIQIFFREASTSENLKIKENLAGEICKMLMINEPEGIRYFEMYKNRYQRDQATDPLISVLITSYNTAEFIESCIRTILFQTYQNIEVIVIDDGSRDNTVKILESIQDARLKVFVFPENKGRVAALNDGLSRCNGEYLALMDSDDLASPLRIEKLYDYLRAHQLDAVSSQLYEFEDKKDFTISKFRTDAGVLKAMMLFYNAVPHAATLFKTETIKAVAYREGFDFAEDYDMMARYAIRYNLGLMNEPLYIYRRRSDSATGMMNTDRSLSSQKKIIKELFDQYLFRVSDAELDLHFDMETHIKDPVTKGQDKLMQIRRWIYKIINMNKNRKVFDTGILKGILLDNYWSIYYYANIRSHGIKSAIKMFTFRDIKLSILIFKEGLKEDLKRITGA